MILRTDIQEGWTLFSRKTSSANYLVQPTETHLGENTPTSRKALKAGRGGRVLAAESMRTM